MKYSILFFVVLLLNSCNLKQQQPVKLVGEAQGTYYSIIYYDDQQRDFQQDIDSILHDFDMSVSLWEPESILSQINNGNNSVVPDEYFIENFRLSEQVSEETGGYFDFTIGSLVSTWGFSIKHDRVIDSATIDSLLNISGYKKVRLEGNRIIKQNPHVKFDFNAIAQGYSVDVIGDFLRSEGISNFLVDIGGEVTTSGNKPDNSLWRVGIEQPTEDINGPQDINAIIALTNKSLATSGSYRKFFMKDGVRYSHMIDPFSGYPAMHNLLSVTVIANNAALADAYATACMVMGLDKAKQFIESKDNIEALFIISDDNNEYQTITTKGFDKLIVE